MAAFPHVYTVSAESRPSGDVPLAVPGLRVLETAPPKEFGGPGNQWSPEHLFTGAVADCFVLNFRAIATASKVEWLKLDVRTEGTLDRVEGKLRFTQFTTHAKLQVPAGADPERARRLLERAEQTCPVANTLNADRHLEAEVVVV
jgi:organic hydroperoxide reductase OsmC/OhrA